MSCRWVVVCLLLWNLIASALGARILAMLPFPGKSHVIFSSSVLRALTGRGHQVVEYSPFPPSKPIANYTHFEVHTSFEEMTKQWSYEDFKRIAQADQPIAGNGFGLVWQMTYPLCEQAFQHESVQKLLNSNEHFDLVITESSFGQESMLVFGHKFNAPTITLQGFVLWSVLNRAAGNALSIASIPDFVSTVMTDHMTFKERAINLLSTLGILYTFYNSHLPVHQRIIKENYPGKAPPLVDMVTNVSLYIINSHPAIEYSQPYTPNIVPVAGISITSERTPLPQDIQKFMDEAKEGVIYFSFGTVVPLHVFPKEVLQIFINVFKKINCKVIWKIELTDMPDLPTNVILRKWLPQPGILSHPNCAVFLTHGGLNSQLEAIHAGVPTVGIPFFGDQAYNVRFNEHHGIGIKVDFKTLSEETLISGLTSVLKNSRFRENAQKMSRIFRDRPVSPVDNVVFWTEYVLRHSGAHHLQPTSAQLTWYQLWLLDIAIVMVVFLLALAVTTYILVSKILLVVLRKKSVTSRKKDN